MLGEVALAAGDREGAAAHFRETVALAGALGMRALEAHGWDGL
jgi:hypothetical protein